VNNQQTIGFDIRRESAAVAGGDDQPGDGSHSAPCARPDVRGCQRQPADAVQDVLEQLPASRQLSRTKWRPSQRPCELRPLVSGYYSVLQRPSNRTASARHEHHHRRPAHRRAHHDARQSVPARLALQVPPADRELARLATANGQAFRFAPRFQIPYSDPGWPA